MTPLLWSAGDYTQGLKHTKDKLLTLSDNLILPPILNMQDSDVLYNLTVASFVISPLQHFGYLSSGYARKQVLVTMTQTTVSVPSTC